jgi:hypothetical protein
MAYVIMAPPVNHADGVMTESTSAQKQKIGLKKTNIKQNGKGRYYLHDLGASQKIKHLF